ncbi:hypothetical protein N42HA_00205 [Lactococcus lactis]|nr:hypothetical protein [Lactococcus lactis]
MQVSRHTRSYALMKETMLRVILLPLRNLSYKKVGLANKFTGDQIHSHQITIDRIFKH